MSRNEFGNPTGILLALFLFILQLPVQSQEYFTDLENPSQSGHWINLKLVDTLQAYSGLNYAVADKDSPFGLGLEGDFPKEISGSNCEMVVEAWVKSNVAKDKAVFVITLQNNGTDLFWKSIKLSEILEEKDTWYKFSERILVPASITKSGKIKAYLWNNDARDTIAIDDLRFSFSLRPIESQIPELSQNISAATLTDNLLVNNDHYSIYFNESKEAISIYSNSGEMLIRNLVSYIASGGGDFYEIDSRNFSLKGIKNKKWGKEINLETENIKLMIKCQTNSQRIEFVATEMYNELKLVERASVVLISEQEVEKVYRSNRKIDRGDFQEEYWLGKQGAQFGSDNDSWLLYHSTHISSLQLQPSKKHLWVNLDYDKDHPFLRFPETKDRVDTKMELSYTVNEKGTTRESRFSIYIGESTADLPRFMKNPFGFLAAFMWTEHADFTDIKTQRATFFGSEEIEEPSNAVGGFVKYGIPVTKSVFYFNPDSISNEETSNGRFPGLESTIKTDAAFEQFLFLLDSLGHEICLHTPEQFTSTKKAMKKSLKYAAKSYASPSWIDHGYNNGLENNREDIVCDGALKGSEHYAMKLWKKYDVKYFWNPYYEDYLTFDSWQFGEQLSKPYYGFGDHFPDPDYWQHPSQTGEVWHWPTKSVLYVERDDLWEFYFNDKVLNEFVESWGVHFNHSYPAWVDPEKGFWYYDKSGIIKARNGFNKTLERMSDLRNEGSLNVTTVKDFMDYQLSVKDVTYKVINENVIEVTNNGDNDIFGLSFTITSTGVTIEDEMPSMKIVGEDIIFWFDLESGETKTITTNNSSQ